MRAINLYEIGIELLSIALLVVGFVISFTTGSAILNYFISFVSGMIFGRIWYKYRKHMRFGWALIIIGYIFGFSMGAVYGNRIVIAAIFFVGVIVAYVLHEKKKV